VATWAFRKGLEARLLRGYNLRRAIDLHCTPELLMSDEDMKAELERLRKENESLKKGAAKGISMKVSEKGGLSIYGLGRFPITLYKEQWTKLLDMSDDIRQFLVTHDAELKTKQ
jgi:hypothetical protein